LEKFCAVNAAKNKGTTSKSGKVHFPATSQIHSAEKESAISSLSSKGVEAKLSITVHQIIGCKIDTSSRISVIAFAMPRLDQ